MPFFSQQPWSFLSEEGWLYPWSGVSDDCEMILYHILTLAHMGTPPMALIFGCDFNRNGVLFRGCIRPAWRIGSSHWDLTGIHQLSGLQINGWYTKSCFTILRHLHLPIGPFALRIISGLLRRSIMTVREARTSPLVLAKCVAKRNHSPNRKRPTHFFQDAEKKTNIAKQFFQDVNKTMFSHIVLYNFPVSKSSMTCRLQKTSWPNWGRFCWWTGEGVTVVLSKDSPGTPVIHL